MSESQSKVVIGSRFSEPWFERRSDSRSYAALFAPMDAHEHRVQRALISPARLMEPDRAPSVLNFFRRILNA